MSAESVIGALGLGDLLARDFISVQLVILTATAALFALSLTMMVMAARSAGGARRARGEAEALLRSAQDSVVEARQLSAKIERAGERIRSEAAVERRHGAPVRVSARETTAEADVEILDLKGSEVVSARNLEAARESATVPKGLLGRSRRR